MPVGGRESEALDWSRPDGGAGSGAFDRPKLSGGKESGGSDWVMPTGGAEPEVNSDKKPINIKKL